MSGALQIRPGRGGGDEVELEATVLSQPLFHVVMVVIAGVIQKDVDFSARSGFPIQPPQQAQELLIAMAMMTFSDYLARAHIVGGEHGRGSVPLVIVSASPALAFLPRQAGLSPI